MSRIIIVISELYDMMTAYKDKTENAIMRLAPWARRTGIHLVAATQRVDEAGISGIIKACFPSRIAFRVEDEAQSKLILDEAGAEKLENPGDMLLLELGSSELRRVKGCFVSDAEAWQNADEARRPNPAAPGAQTDAGALEEEKKKYTEYLDEAERFLAVIEAAKEALPELDSVHSDAIVEEENVQINESAGEKGMLFACIPQDEKLIQAIELAIEYGSVTITRLQRNLRIGYARAERLIEEMAELGVVAGQENPTKPRKTLISREDWQRMQENWK